MDLPELLYKAGQDNRVAQRKIYDFFAKKMFLLCRQYMKDDMTTEEIVINGFMRFFRSLAGFRYLSEYATYNFLKKIMINECLRYLKNNRDLFVVLTEQIPECGLPEEIIAQLSAKEIYMLIAQ